MSKTSSPSVAIVTPVHQGHLDASEQVSMALLRKHLGHYDCYLVYPQGLTLQWDTHGLIHLPLSKRRFKSIKTYNQMCLDPDFYQQFSAYEYILICQTDAYVYQDQLPYWCQQNYSYIGAPFVTRHYSYIGVPWVKRRFFIWQNSIMKRLFKRNLRNSNQHHRWGLVGNGGFSLRHVPSCIKQLKKPCHHNAHWLWLTRYINSRNKIMVWYQCLVKKPRTIGQLLRHICAHPRFHYSRGEDCMWSLLGLHDAEFTTPPPQAAAHFSIENIQLSAFLPNQPSFGIHGHVLRSQHEYMQLLHRLWPEHNPTASVDNINLHLSPTQ